jgi:hypothetical protein
LRIGCMLFAIAAPLRPASADGFRSVYTRFDTKHCHHDAGRSDEDYGSWRCPGFDHLPILLMAADQRMYVTFGPERDNDLASAQTFPAFNDVHAGTVEWRLASTGTSKPHAVATILRWNVMTGHDMANAKGPVVPTGRVLVITRLGHDGTCHIGYVDARQNGDANALARKIADRAGSFRCGRDRPKILGTTDPDLLLPRSD